MTRKARIIPTRDKNGATYWIVHPDDRVVRKLPTTKPTDEPPAPSDGKEQQP